MTFLCINKRIVEVAETCHNSANTGNAVRESFAKDAAIAVVVEDVESPHKIRPILAGAVEVIGTIPVSSVHTLTSTTKHDVKMSVS